MYTWSGTQKLDHLDNLYCQAAATHEAGHAIANIVIGDTNIVASLDHRDICIGRVSSNGPAHPDQNTAIGRAQIANIIFSYLAGHVAEQIFWSTQNESQRPDAIANWGGDQQSANKYADLLAYDQLAANAIVKSIMDSCVLFFGIENNSKALIRLAKSLHLKMTLDDGEIRALNVARNPRLRHSRVYPPVSTSVFSGKWKKIAPESAVNCDIPCAGLRRQTKHCYGHKVGYREGSYTRTRSASLQSGASGGAGAGMAGPLLQGAPSWPRKPPSRA